jgi:hypothetical protein
MPNISLLYDGLNLTTMRLAPGDTALLMPAGAYKYAEYKIGFDSGGTTAITAGMRILGATSGAQAVVTYVPDLTSGTWAGGDAVGFLYLKSWTGIAFQNNEKLTVEAVADDATVDGTIITLGQKDYINPNFYGKTARQLWIQGETQSLKVGCDGTIPAQTSLIGFTIPNGSTMILTDADNMAKCYLINAANGSNGFANVLGIF